MIRSAQEYLELEAQLRRFEITGDRNQRLYHEWSYLLAIGNEGSSPHEIGSRSEYAQSHNPTTRSEVVSGLEPSEEARSQHRITGSWSEDSQHHYRTTGLRVVAGVELLEAAELPGSPLSGRVLPHELGPGSEQGNTGERDTDRRNF